MPATPTRERLLNEAMRLFAEQGYQATSVAQIEAAAGLAPGRGALYNHFKSKELLFLAGIDRQLDRRHAMRDIRSLFAGLSDLKSELTILGRYLLGVLDNETQLLQIASRVPPELAASLNTAYAALFEGLHAELAEWLTSYVPNASRAEIAAVAAVGVNALLGRRATTAFFYPASDDMSDEDYVEAWTTMLRGQVEVMRLVEEPLRSAAEQRV